MLINDLDRAVPQSGGPLAAELDQRFRFEFFQKRVDIWIVVCDP